MDLFVIGISHRTAPVEVREKVALPGPLSRQLLRTMHAEKTFEEILVADTCNRTEFYFVPHNDADPLPYILDHVARAKGAPADVEPSLFYRHRGPDAVRHLFSVAAGLDSQIVGESEILGQLKTGYRLALEERTAKFLLNKLMHRAFRVGKRIRTETQLGFGSTSVAQAAAELAGQVFAELAGKTILLVGAGKTVEAAAKTLVRPGVKQVIVANRTLSRAQELAADLSLGRGPAQEADEPITCPALLRLLGLMNAPGGSAPTPARIPARAVELVDLPAVIGEADIVLCSTGSPDLVLTHEALAEPIRRRQGLLLIVDIAVPRDVDPRLGKLPNVFLHNINDLDKVVEGTLARRRSEIPKAQAILDYEVAKFSAWRDSLDANATILQLRRRFELVQVEQLERYGRKFDPAAREQLQAFTQALINKALHQPITFLRSLSQEADTSEQLLMVDAVRRMFDLDSIETPGEDS
ncbi:MAG: glutamyl-tRNA reductase [Planctomycetota bacterium]|nr:glutamyl-tRNA reductase [Planctomycetota bacterium]